MKILITAGPTREFFDSVRFISNPSSGRMGYALAAAARDRGHSVVLVSGPVALSEPTGVETIRVVSAAEMAAACKRIWADQDAGIMTAAVCDYRPSEVVGHKLQKKDAIRPITLEPTEDIATSLGSVKEHRVLIGFAMEDHDYHAHAEGKLRRKHCDAIVLNGPENVGGDDATVEILLADEGWNGPVQGTKAYVADHIIRLAEHIAERRG